MRVDQTRESDRPSLVVEAVSKRFGDVVAVGGVDLEVWPGEIVALLGPNGAGKTTTLELCEGFLAPDSGRVRLFGLDPVASQDRLRSRLGIMVQGGGGYPGVRAGEMLELVTSCAARPHDSKWLLATLGLEEVVRTKYRRLSAGQRQRLSLACAIAGRPKIVFLDEPTEGLDPAGRQLVWDMVRSLRADGVAVVVTTHAIHEIEQVADRVIIVDCGRVIAAGTTDDISRRHAANLLTFSASASLDVEELHASLGPPYTVEEPAPGQYTVVGLISPAVVGAVTAWGAAQRVLLSDLHISAGGLQSTVMALTCPEMSAR